MGDDDDYKNFKFDPTNTQTFAGQTPYVTQLRHGHALRTRAEAAAKAPIFPGQRVAPLSPLQLQTERLLKENLARQQQADTFKVMRQEVDQSRGRNILKHMNYDLSAAREAPDAYIHNYMAKLTPYLRDLRQERREDFERYAFPQVGGSFAAAGAYNSGAREAAEHRARQEFEKNLGREQNKLAFEGYNAANEHHHKHASTHTELAKLVGHTTAQQKEHDLMAAQGIGNIERQRADQEKLQRAELGDQGYRQQEQHQREIEEEKKRFYEEADHVKKNLAWEGNMLSGHPVAMQGSYSAAAAPPPTNYSHMAASALQQVPGVGAMQPKKSGGRVGRYAPGGHVLPPSYADNQLPAFNTPEMHNIRQTANDLGNTHPHNGAISMGIAGATMGKSMGGPWGAYSKGNKAGFENYQNVEQSRYLNKERGANLMAKINDSRLDQQKVLNEYSQKQQDFEQKKLLDASTINMHNAHANYYNSVSGIGNGQEDPGDRPTKKMTASREKAIQEADNAITALLEGIDVTEEAGSALEKVNSGPVIGGIAEAPILKQTGLGPHIAAAIPNSGSPEDISNASAIGSEYLKQLGDLGEKHGRNVAELRVSQSGKIGVDKYPAYNKWHKEKTVKKFKEGLNRELRKLELNGASPNMIAATKERIEKRFKAERPTIEQASDHGKPSGGQDKVAILKEAIAAQKAANAAKKANGHE